MPRKSARASRKRRDDLLGLVILGSVFIVFAIGYGMYSKAKKAQVPLDSVTLCPLDGPSGVTVLLIDRTDPLGPVQTADLRQHLLRIRDGLPLYEGIEIYSIGPVVNEVLSEEGPMLCNSGRAEDVDSLTANPRLTEKRWKERFAEPLQKVFDKLLEAGHDERSPIMESIQSVSVTAFGSLSPKAKHRRLIIASDMLQNTEALDQYKGDIIPFSQFKTTAEYKRLRTDLQGVEVEILYFERNVSPQGRKHIEFWQEYFADSGAKLVRVTRIQG